MEDEDGGAGRDYSLIQTGEKASIMPKLMERERSGEFDPC